MPITAPPTIDALPSPPDPNDRSTFNTRAYPWSVAQQTFATQVAAVASNVHGNATEAQAQAAEATTSAATATTKAAEAQAAATTATTQASTATTKATEASSSATAAAGSASSASGSATAAATSAAQAAASAASISSGPVTSVNGKTGVAVLTPADIGVQTVYLGGPAAVYVTQSVVYTITNFNIFSAYAVSVSAGSAARSGDQITLTAPATAQTVTLTVTMDGHSQAFSVAVQPASVATPTNSSPATGATGQLDSVTLTASAFEWLGLSDTHASSDWQLATDAGFTTVLQSQTASTSNKTSWTVSGLSVSTTYYWRVRYTGTANGTSGWSTAFSFTTAATFNSYIATPTATPAAFGDALEGGFYAGLIWNELVQSSTSTTIGTGSKTFAVPNMTSTPIVYAGQTLEVRSRANPANKMVGTVTGALGTSLTLNITSVGGSGTFTDWSVMAKYRVIVAPKASGENAGIAYKNANTAAPAATGTLTEGRKATLAMVAADTSTVYPAAHWCNNLNIGGKTDWYLPARDELELCWRNLKPVTNSNYTTADRPTAATPNYANLGSYGDTAATHGLNNNSSPTGAAYTASVPGQTAATAFRTGGAEAYEFGSSYYWSSTEYSATNAWGQSWYSSNPGLQVNISKTGAYRVRAVRRSII